MASVTSAPLLTDGSPKGHPVVGNLLAFRRDQLGFVKRCARVYGDLVPVRVVGHRAFLANHPDLIEEVLVTRNGDFRKVFMLRNARLCLGDGLLTSEGDHWKRQRRLVQPGFHRDRILAYGEIMLDEIRQTAREWRARKEVDVHDEMMQLTLRIVLRCLFDTTEVAGLDRVTKSVDVIQEHIRRRVTAVLPLPDTAPTLRSVSLRRSVRVLDRLVYSLIDERRRSGAVGSDLLSTLIRLHGKGSAVRIERKLRDEVMTILLAGHETTALALTWSWYLLALNPEVATRVVEEMKSTVGDRDLTTADIPRLRSVEQVVKESLRMYPPVYMFGRDAVRDTTIGGHTIRAGTSIVITPWVLHRDPRFFDHPEQFDPARWTEEFEKTLARYAYCPFGGGSRLCIGKGFAMAEMVLALATLIRDYRLDIVGTTPVELVPCFTLRPRGGMPMAVSLR